MTYPIVSRGLCCNCAQSILNISRASVVPLHRQYLSPVQKSQQRFASILSSLSDNPSAYHKAKRLGRGPSSGKGKTSGRGHKGQKQHGKVPSGFEGGQTPIEVVHGKYGFKNVYALFRLHHRHAWPIIYVDSQSTLQRYRSLEFNLGSLRAVFHLTVLSPSESSCDPTAYRCQKME